MKVIESVKVKYKELDAEWVKRDEMVRGRCFFVCFFRIANVALKEYFDEEFSFETGKVELEAVYQKRRIMPGKKATAWSGF